MLPNLRRAARRRLRPFSDREKKIIILGTSCLAGCVTFATLVRGPIRGPSSTSDVVVTRRGWTRPKGRRPVHLSPHTDRIGIPRWRDRRFESRPLPASLPLPGYYCVVFPRRASRAGFLFPLPVHGAYPVPLRSTRLKASRMGGAGRGSRNPRRAETFNERKAGCRSLGLTRPKPLDRRGHRYCAVNYYVRGAQNMYPTGIFFSFFFNPSGWEL